MSIHKVFRPQKKGDVLRTAYLHADGHVVCIFERRVFSTRVEYVKVAQSIGVHCNFPAGEPDAEGNRRAEGRVVFHDPAALVALSQLPDARVSFYTDNASTKAKEHNVKVASLYVESPGFGGYCIDESSVNASAVTIQVPGTYTRFHDGKDNEVFADLRGKGWYGDNQPIVDTYEDEPKRAGGAS